MKERDDLTAHGVDPGQIRSLRGVTPVAGERKIVRFIRPAVLPCDDMLNMMREPALFLPKQAIFTTIPRTLANELACRGIH
jgi:hypothetical protein